VELTEWIAEAATLIAMNSQQPSSLEGDHLFRAMEDMLRRYAQRMQAGRPVAGDAPARDGRVGRSDATAAAYQLAGYIATTTDPHVTPDPGAAAAFLMVVMEYLDPEATDLNPGSRAALENMVGALRQSGA